MNYSSLKLQAFVRNMGEQTKNSLSLTLKQSNKVYMYELLIKIALKINLMKKKGGAFLHVICG